jgi:hypothetical protein
MNFFQDPKIILKSSVTLNLNNIQLASLKLIFTQVVSPKLGNVTQMKSGTHFGDLNLLLRLLLGRVIFCLSHTTFQVDIVSLM